MGEYLSSALHYHGLSFATPTLLCCVCQWDSQPSKGPGSILRGIRQLPSFSSFTSKERPSPVASPLPIHMYHQVTAVLQGKAVSVSYPTPPTTASPLKTLPASHLHFLPPKGSSNPIVPWLKSFRSPHELPNSQSLVGPAQTALTCDGPTRPPLTHIYISSQIRSHVFNPICVFCRPEVPFPTTTG